MSCDVLHIILLTPYVSRRSSPSQGNGTTSDFQVQLKGTIAWYTSWIGASVGFNSLVQVQKWHQTRMGRVQAGRIMNRVYSMITQAIVNAMRLLTQISLSLGTVTPKFRTPAK